MLQIIIAFLAGILTIAAPCILPLLPIILGTSVGKTSKTRPLFIVLGFTLTFSAAAIILSYLANHLGLNANVIRNLAILLLICFGIFAIWPNLLERLAGKLLPLLQRQPGTAPVEKNNLDGFLLGVTLGLVWTPCAGPVLGTVLTLVAAQKALFSSIILLIAYSLGAGVPMLLIAYGGQYITTRLRSVARYSRLIQQIFGVIIILLAFALFFNLDTKLYTIILQNFPSLNLKF